MPPMGDGVPRPRSLTLWVIATAVMEFIFMCIMSTIWYGLLALDLRRHSQARLDESPPLNYRVWPRAAAMLMPLVAIFLLSFLLVIMLIPIVLSLPDPTDMEAFMEALMGAITSLIPVFEAWAAITLVAASIPRWGVMYLLARDLRSHLAQAGKTEYSQAASGKFYAPLWLLLYAAIFSLQLLSLLSLIIPSWGLVISIVTSVSQIASIAFLVLYFYDLQSKLNQHSYYHAEALMPSI